MLADWLFGLHTLVSFAVAAVDFYFGPSAEAWLVLILWVMAGLIYREYRAVWNWDGRYTIKTREDDTD